MEEVRIYHVPWGSRAWWAFLIVWAFVGLFVWLFMEEPHLRDDVMMWFGLIVFGVMGMFFPVVALWERLARCPAITVMSDGVICYSLWKKHEYRFDDVYSFELYEMDLGRAKHRFVNVNFLKQVKERRMKDASKMGREVRRFNMRLAGAQENMGLRGLL